MEDTKNGIIVDNTNVSNVNTSSELENLAERENKRIKLAEAADEEVSNDENNLTYKLKITNLNYKSTAKTFKKHLASQKCVDNIKIKKAPKWNHAILTFDNIDDLNDTKSKLEGTKVKDLEIHCTEVIEKLHNSRVQHDKINVIPIEESKKSPEDIAKLLNNQVTPLWEKPYDQQIVIIEREVRKVLAAFRKRLNESRKNKDLTQAQQEMVNWIDDPKYNDFGLLPCIRSPEINNYRTKCEFSFGKDSSGIKNLGFLMGLYKNGCTEVVSIETTVNVSEAAKKLVFHIQDYVRKNALDVYDRVQNVGFWRSCQIRTHSNGEVLAVIQINPNDLSAEKIEEEKQNIKNFLLEKKKENLIELKTLLFQNSNDLFNGITDKDTFEISFGDGTISETLLDTKFKISPNSFFQINTKVAELLYSSLRELCKEFKNEKNLEGNLKSELPVVLLDLCCGTGTIGQILSPEVDSVIGVDIIEDAINDARNNASINNLKNVEYITGKVEDSIRSVIQKHVYQGAKESGGKKKRAIAILDPPRAGSHPNVIKSVREFSAIETVIFVSCDANLAKDNFFDLCRPTTGKFHGTPFKLIRVQAFDMFPHTKNFELVLVFKR
ncbi:tRNA methyltransferase 2 [Lobulomyces angularis]|nr:tRNA methyltransferase 2 [Lobulomyces angularis]